MKSPEVWDSREAEAEQLAREISPVENVELGLGINLFEKRAKWAKLMSVRVRECVEDMVRFCGEAQKKLPGYFLFIIGAQNPDGSVNQEAKESSALTDTSEEEFLKHAREFLGEMLIDMPLEEAAEILPVRDNLDHWLKGLGYDLSGAMSRMGEEVVFREKQDRLRELKKELALNLDKAA